MCSSEVISTIGSAEAAVSSEEISLAPMFHPKRLSLGAFVGSTLSPSFLTKAAPELASTRRVSPRWSDSTVLDGGTGLAGGSGVARPRRVS